MKTFLTQGFVGTVIHTYTARMVLILFGIISNMILTRSLGVEHYGVYVLALTIIALGTQFGNLGLHAANLHYAAKYKRMLGMLTKNAMAAALLLGVAIDLSLLGLRYAFPDLIDLHTHLFALIIGIIPVSLLSLYLKHLLIGMGDIKYDNKVSLLSRAVTLLLLLLGAFLLHMDEALAIGIFAVGLLIGVVLSFAKIKRTVVARYQISTMLMKKIVPFGLKAYFSSLLAFLVLKSDLFFVNYYLTKQDLGNYALAVSFVDYLYMLPVIIGTILFQKLSKTKENEKKIFVLKSVFFYFVFFYFVFLIFIYLFSKNLVFFLYGSEFLNAVEPIHLLLIAIFFMGINTLLQQFIATIGFPITLIYFWGAGLIANVTLNFLFIQDYGLLAVSMSTILSYGIVMILTLMLTKNRIQRIKSGL